MSRGADEGASRSGVGALARGVVAVDVGDVGVGSTILTHEWHDAVLSAN